MDAIRNTRCVIALLGSIFLSAQSVDAQTRLLPALAQSQVRSENFVVFAATRELADEVARNAEQQRHELAVHWLGHPIPPWSQPCLRSA